MFPALSLRKTIKERKWETEGLRRYASILHPPPPTLRPPPHLLVSRSTVMLGVGHMVCAEDAGAGVALERQKICREQVGLQVQRDLSVVPTHSAFHSGERKTPPGLQPTAPSPRPLSPKPRPLGHRPPTSVPALLRHCQPRSPPFAPPATPSPSRPGPAPLALRPSPKR